MAGWSAAGGRRRGRRLPGGSGEIARRAGAKVLATEPPAGWTGKAWACWQGASVATGEMLVFVDADTEPAPGFVARLSAATARSGGMVVSSPPTGSSVSTSGPRRRPTSSPSWPERDGHSPAAGGEDPSASVRRSPFPDWRTSTPADTDWSPPTWPRTSPSLTPCPGGESRSPPWRMPAPEISGTACPARLAMASQRMDQEPGRRCRQGPPVRRLSWGCG